MDVDLININRSVRKLSVAPSRRRALLLLAALPIDRYLTRTPIPAQAKKRKKGKVTLCQDGQTIQVPKKAKKKRLKQGATPGACAVSPPPPPPPPPLTVSTPFTIEAHWVSARDHDTYLRLPNAAGSTDPNPYIDYTCNPANSKCEEDLYPYLCVEKDASGPGDEVTTVRRLIGGRYEYWIEVHLESPAGDLAVNLKNSAGAVLMSWSSPANPSAAAQRAWHVFDVDGGTGIVTSIDQTLNEELPEVFAPYTFVCPR